MLLFKKHFHSGLVSGAIRLTFRRWDKPHVRAGGRYRCHPIGVLEVDRVERVLLSTITDDDARLAGFDARDALFSFIASGPGGEATPDTEVYRIELHHGGDGDRVEIALDATLTKEDVATIREKLARMDRDEPWTGKTLRLVEKNPRIAASKLAAKVGRETLDFKADVVKLKKLGLTQSFEVGYEVSPRGRAYLEATRKKRVAR